MWFLLQNYSSTMSHIQPWVCMSCLAINPTRLLSPAEEQATRVSMKGDVTPLHAERKYSANGRSGTQQCLICFMSSRLFTRVLRRSDRLRNDISSQRRCMLSIACRPVFPWTQRRVIRCDKRRIPDVLVMAVICIQWLGITVFLVFHWIH